MEEAMREDIVKEFQRKLEEWKEKSKEERKIRGLLGKKPVYNLLKVKGEIHNFLMDKIVPLPKEDVQRIFGLTYIYAMAEEGLEKIFSSVLRALFEINPQFYPFNGLWSHGKSLLTLSLESLIENAEEEIKDQIKIAMIKTPPFSTFIISSPKELQDINKLFIEPFLFKVTKDSYIVEILFDYLSYLQPSQFIEYIFTENEEGELTFDLQGVQKVTNFLLRVWRRRNKKFGFVGIPNKLRKLYPIVINFIRKNEKLIEEISQREAILFLEKEVWYNDNARERVAEYVKELFFDDGEESPVEKDTINFLAEVLLKGLSYLDPEEVTENYDSNAIYEGLSFLLANYGESAEFLTFFLSFFDELSTFPYISRKENHKEMVRLLIIVLIPFLTKEPPSNLINAERLEKEPLKILPDFLPFILNNLPPEKELKLLLLSLLVKSLFKLKMHKDVLMVLRKLNEEEKRELFEFSPEVELIEVMSKFFNKEISSQDAVKIIEKKEEIFDLILDGEVENLIRIIKGEKTEDLVSPLTLLYYYPYSEELYKECELNFD